MSGSGNSEAYIAHQITGYPASEPEVYRQRHRRESCVWSLGAHKLSSTTTVKAGLYLR